MNKLNLRPYQQKGKEQLYQLLSNGIRRILFVLATGGGKTTCFSDLAREIGEYGGQVVIIMRRRELVKQTSKVFDNFGIEHGVYMAGHPRYVPARNVQICSVDTLDAREQYPHDGNPNAIILVDESHDINTSTKKYSKILNKYKDNIIVGYTATPYADNSMFHAVVNPITPIELLELGNLVPVRPFCPNLIDVQGVGVSRTGDFNEDELFALCSKSEIIGNVVNDWKKYGAGKRTVLFAVNVEHSKILCEAFNKEGINAIHCDASTKSIDRDRAIRMLKEREIQILSSVNIFSTGTDIPEIECISFARPTKSLIYYLQAIGRGLRPSENKKECLLIDNAGNFLRFGSPFKNREIKLTKEKHCKKDSRDESLRTCKQCFYVFEVKDQTCPSCGYKNPPVVRTIAQKEGELVEFHLSDEEVEAIQKRNFKSDFYKLIWIAKSRIFKNEKSFIRREELARHWTDMKLMEKYGKEYLEFNYHLLPRE